tara:strand:+ start:11730 stop:12665 length:936 start_codon:yes stop_codon:yes gene_type:complete
MIESKNITFVVQGAIFKTKSKSTYDVVFSIRKFYPDSKVILSTWEGQKLEIKLTTIIDELVLSKDPGDYTPNTCSPININRQLVSSINGIKKVKTLYTVKTRTDLVFVSNNLANIFPNDLDLNKDYLVGENRVVLADICSKNHRKGIKVPFWLCDFIYFGLTNDVKKIFDTDPYPEEYFDFYIKNKHPSYFQDKKHTYKYVPESYITFNYLNRLNVKFEFENTYHSDVNTLDLYEQSLINNFIIYPPETLGIESLKYRFPMIPRNIMFSQNDWIDVYNKSFGKKLKKSVYFEVNIFVRYWWIKLISTRDRN